MCFLLLFFLGWVADALLCSWVQYKTDSHPSTVFRWERTNTVRCVSSFFSCLFRFFVCISAVLTGRDVDSLLLSLSSMLDCSLRCTTHDRTVSPSNRPRCIMELVASLRVSLFSLLSEHYDL